MNCKIKNVIYLLMLVLLLVANSQSFSKNINVFLDHIEKRSNDLKNEKPYKVHVTSIISEMNGEWEPKKITTIHKIVTKTDSSETTEIKSSTIEVKGRKKDNTKNAIKDAQKKKGKENNMRVGKFLPFIIQNREYYDFKLLPDSTINGQSVLVLQCVAREKSDKHFDGEYYINSNDFTLLGFRARPSKNPKMVKDMYVEIKFGINESDLYAVKRFIMRTHIKVLVKNFRFHFEETYEKYQYLD
jgi:hypothetical protein